MSRRHLPEATSVAARCIKGHLWVHSDSCVPEWRELRADKVKETNAKGTKMGLEETKNAKCLLFANVEH